MTISLSQHKIEAVKHYISKFLKTVAVLYMAFPVTYGVLAAILFDVPAANCGRLLLQPFFYFVSGLAIVTGYGLWEMRRWSWYMLLVVNILIAIENAIVVHDFAETHHYILAYMVSLIMLSGVMHRISREVRVPYFFPKIRWWESDPRYKLSVPVKLERASVQLHSPSPPVLEGEILDLSMGGCFVKLRTEIQIDETVRLDFKVFGTSVENLGVVVWCTKSTVTHPKGVGIKFTLPSKEQKRSLKTITSRLRKISSLYRRARYLTNREEFSKRLAELEGNGA